MNSEVQGWLNIYKPRGISSFKAVYKYENTIRLKFFIRSFLIIIEIIVGTSFFVSLFGSIEVGMGDELFTRPSGI